MSGFFSENVSNCFPKLGAIAFKTFIARPGIASPQILSRGKLALSIIKTFKPFLRSVNAQLLPPGPPPIIIISYNLLLFCFFVADCSIALLLSRLAIYFNKPLRFLKS